MKVAKVTGENWTANQETKTLMKSENINFASVYLLCFLFDSGQHWNSVYTAHLIRSPVLPETWSCPSENS